MQTIQSETNLPPAFTLTTYRLTLSAHDLMRFPPFKGSALRGGFGHAFKSIICAELDECGKYCSLGNACAYGYIFETSPPEEAEALRNFGDIPRPFIIEPPLDRQTDYAPGETLTFQLKLIGHAADFLTYFTLAFRELGRRGLGVALERPGLGKKRGRFRLTRIEAVNPLSGTQQTVFDQAERNRIQLRSLPVDSATITTHAATLPTDRITLNFLTPTRLKHRGRWVNEGPPFQALIKVLLSRTSSLSYFHCGQRLDVDFRGLIDRAAEVKTARCQTHWEDWSRFSGRQKQRVEMGGLVGRVTYAGDLGGYLPLLALGELIHVGKGTIFGNGQYEIVMNGKG